MNQSKQSIEPCDRSSQSKYISRMYVTDWEKSVLRITEIRSRRTVTLKRLISCLLRHMSI